jgi:hypothetical protein
MRRIEAVYKAGEHVSEIRPKKCRLAFSRQLQLTPHGTRLRHQYTRG